jgi:hypothetical protein
MDESMLIDINDGGIRVGNKGFIINDLLTNDIFSHTSLSSMARKEIINKYTWYYFQQNIGDDEYNISLCFSPNGKIDMVGLTIMVKNASHAWENWSLSEQKDKKRFHDIWLEENIGLAPNSRKFGDENLKYYEYKWGRIESIFDPRSGSSKIICRYYEK